MTRLDVVSYISHGVSKIAEEGGVAESEASEEDDDGDEDEAEDEDADRPSASLARDDGGR